MANFYNDENYVKGSWANWCTHDDSEFLFGVVIDRKELWVRVLMNIGIILWVEVNETIKLNVG